MGLVDHEQVVGRKIIQQRPWWRSRRSLLQVPGIVLDARAVTNLADHLQIVLGALFQPLRLQKTALTTQVAQSLLKLSLNVGQSLLSRLLRGDKVFGGKDAHLVQVHQHLAGEGIDLGDALDLVAPEANAVGGLAIGRHHLEGVAPHAEGSRLQLQVVARVIDAHQVAEQPIAPESLPSLQLHHHPAPLVGVTEGIDARNRGDDDDILAGKQSRRGSQAQPLDLFVDVGVLLDVQIVPGNVCLRLVIVIVGDKVLDRVLGKELAELGVKLGSKRLVVGQDQRGLLNLLDHL